MRWKDSVVKLVGCVQPALQATCNTLQLLGVEGDPSDFDAVMLALTRGELRSRVAVKRELSERAGAVLDQFLCVERTEEELAELEEEIAHRCIAELIETWGAEATSADLGSNSIARL